MRESAINCPPAFSGRPPSLPSPLPRTGQGHLGLVSHLVMMMRVFYTNTSSYELIHEASKRGPSGCALCRVDYLECRLWFADHVHARLLLLRNASNDYLTQRCIASLFALPICRFLSYMRASIRCEFEDQSVLPTKVKSMQNTHVPNQYQS